MPFRDMKKRNRAPVEDSQEEQLAATPESAGLLGKLPRELLKHVGSFLEPEFEFALACTCKYVASVVAARSWHNTPCKDSRRPCDWARCRRCPSPRAALALLGRDCDPRTTTICLHHYKIHRRKTNGLKRFFLGSCRCYVYAIDLPYAYTKSYLRLNDVQMMIKGYMDVEKSQIFQPIFGRDKDIYIGARCTTMGDVTVYAKVINGQFILATQVRNLVVNGFKPAAAYFRKHPSCKDYKIIDYRDNGMIEEFATPPSGQPPKLHGEQPFDSWEHKTSWHNFHSLHGGYSGYCSGVLRSGCTGDLRTVKVIRSGERDAFIKIDIFTNLEEGHDIKRLMKERWWQDTYYPFNTSIDSIREGDWVKEHEEERCSQRCTERCAKRPQLERIVDHSFRDHEESLDKTRRNRRRRYNWKLNNVLYGS